MDFSPLTDALASKSYEKIADICDELMLKVLFLYLLNIYLIFFFVILL
jgi:hypothetical protein